MTPTTRRRLEALEAQAGASTAGLYVVIMRPDMSMAEMEEQAREAAAARATGQLVMALRVVTSDGDGRPAPGQEMH